MTDISKCFSSSNWRQCLAFFVLLVMSFYSYADQYQYELEFGAEQYRWPNTETRIGGATARYYIDTVEINKRAPLIDSGFLSKISSIALNYTDQSVSSDQLSGRWLSDFVNVDGRFVVGDLILHASLGQGDDQDSYGFGLGLYLDERSSIEATYKDSTQTFLPVGEYDVEHMQVVYRRVSYKRGGYSTRTRAAFAKRRSNLEKIDIHSAEYMLFPKPKVGFGLQGVKEFGRDVDTDFLGLRVDWAPSNSIMLKGEFGSMDTHVASSSRRFISNKDGNYTKLSVRVRF